MFLKKLFRQVFQLDQEPPYFAICASVGFFIYYIISGMIYGLYSKKYWFLQSQIGSAIGVQEPFRHTLSYLLLGIIITLAVSLIIGIPEMILSDRVKVTLVFGALCYGFYKLLML